MKKFVFSKVKDTIVVNDRWGFGVSGHHGSFLTNGDAYLPGHLMKTKWESCFTLDVRSWGYRRDIKVSIHSSTYMIIVGRCENFSSSD